MSGIFHFSFFNQFVPKITNIVEREIAFLKSGIHTFEAQKVSALIAGDTIVKTFFGVAFNEQIEDQSIAVWFSQFLTDTVSQERSLRYFVFGLKIL